MEWSLVIEAPETQPTQFFELGGLSDRSSDGDFTRKHHKPVTLHLALLESWLGKRTICKCHEACQTRTMQSVCPRWSTQVSTRPRRMPFLGLLQATIIDGWPGELIFNDGIAGSREADRVSWCAGRTPESQSDCPSTLSLG